MEEIVPDTGVAADTREVGKKVSSRSRPMSVERRNQGKPNVLDA